MNQLHRQLCALYGRLGSLLSLTPGTRSLGLQPILVEHNGQDLASASQMLPADVAGLERIPSLYIVAFAQRAAIILL
jgi:hypothetical protein